MIDSGGRPYRIKKVDAASWLLAGLLRFHATAIISRKCHT
jgi:hypothetical protein